MPGKETCERIVAESINEVSAHAELIGSATTEGAVDDRVISVRRAIDDAAAHRKILIREGS